MLENYPDTAKRANVQCENCHGPQMSSAHFDTLLEDGDARVSLGVYVCGFCHGETPRYSKLQQWQLSAHSNYYLADWGHLDDSCSRCHTGQGFLAWLPQFMHGDPGPIHDPNPLTENNEAIYWTSQTVVPQTCSTCHDPHQTGTKPGKETDTHVRIFGTTPKLTSGYIASELGNGALCISCHSTPIGLYNDETASYKDFQEGRGPHFAPQGDIFMGENAFFVETGQRSPHSYLEDSCVNCHMEQTRPPEKLVNDDRGTNHTFFADRSICLNCHSSIDVNSLQTSVASRLDELQHEIERCSTEFLNSLLVEGPLI